MSGATSGLAQRRIGGYPVVDVLPDALVERVNARLDAREPTELYFANTNFVLGCRGDRDALLDPRVIIANDGIGMAIASRLVHGRSFAANLNGTDFTPYLFDRLAVRARVFLVGGTAATVAKAAAVWSAHPRVDVVGAVDGFDGLRDDRALVESIRRAAPDVLLLALGNPLQERWAIAHRARIAVPLVIGVGALFDFVAGTVPRAPPAIRRLRLEWLYRLGLEPRRLARRYSLDLARFFAHCLRTARDERRDAARPAA